MASSLAQTLRWTPSDDGKGGVLRLRRSRQAFHLFAALWNLILPQVTTASPLFIGAGVAAAIVFAYFFVRATVNTTLLRFDGGRFTCRFGPLPPRAHFTHVVGDISTFVVEQTPDREEWIIAIVTRSGAHLRVPVDLDGFTLVHRGTNKALFGRARAEHAQLIADALNESLDLARREGSLYRIAGVEPERPAEDSDDLSSSTRRHGAST